MRVLLVSLLACCMGGAQVCRLSVAGLNRNRVVKGDISAECPTRPLHSAPFGNWGVTSNYGFARDSHQFDGWCHDSRICDNKGNCGTSCRDGWYEWNSCTTHADFRPPNCTLYNSAECSEQVTATGVNVHGTQTVEVRVRCPIDSNNDGVADAGGCADVKQYTHSRNFMSLYELDRFTGSELIQTLYFPLTPIPLNCTPGACPPSGSAWVQPESFDSPASPQKVFAEMATIVNSGTFVDATRVCRVLVTMASTVSAASFRPAVAPDSIATLFGMNLTEGGTSVVRIFVVDAADSRREAKVLYSSPTQINFVLPADTPPGEASLSVESAQGLRALSRVGVQPVAPAVFTADGSGSGFPAAQVFTVGFDGRQQMQLATEPIDVTGSRESVLVLYGTGIRRGRETQTFVGGFPAEVLFVGPQPEFAGLDQINVRLPKAIGGMGSVLLGLSVDGLPANIVTLRVR